MTEHENTTPPPSDQLTKPAGKDSNTHGSDAGRRDSSDEGEDEGGVSQDGDDSGVRDDQTPAH